MRPKQTYFPPTTVKTTVNLPTDVIRYLSIPHNYYFLIHHQSEIMDTTELFSPDYIILA